MVHPFASSADFANNIWYGCQPIRGASSSSSINRLISIVIVTHEGTRINAGVTNNTIFILLAGSHTRCRLYTSLSGVYGVRELHTAFWISIVGGSRLTPAIFLLSSTWSYLTFANATPFPSFVSFLDVMGHCGKFPLLFSMCQLYY